MNRPALTGDQALALLDEIAELLTQLGQERYAQKDSIQLPKHWGDYRIDDWSISYDEDCNELIYEAPRLLRKYKLYLSWKLSEEVSP